MKSEEHFSQNMWYTLTKFQLDQLKLGKTAAIETSGLLDAPRCVIYEWFSNGI